MFSYSSRGVLMTAGAGRSGEGFARRAISPRLDRLSRFRGASRLRAIQTGETPLAHWTALRPWSLGRWRRRLVEWRGREIGGLTRVSFETNNESLEIRAKQEGL